MAKSSVKSTIPRPLNCFLLYRLEKQKEIVAKCAGANHRDISKIIAKWWKEASDEEKKPFREQAKIAKLEHSKLYPDYKYMPKKKKNPKRVYVRKNKNGFTSREEENNRVMSLLYRDSNQLQTLKPTHPKRNKATEDMQESIPIVKREYLEEEVFDHQMSPEYCYSPELPFPDTLLYTHQDSQSINNSPRSATSSEHYNDFSGSSNDNLSYAVTPPLFHDYEIHSILNSNFTGYDNGPFSYDMNASMNHYDCNRPYDNLVPKDVSAYQMIAIYSGNVLRRSCYPEPTQFIDPRLLINKTPYL
ncbi:hypothetical protein BDB01DRAFT_862821 [Pilobolus umbonatus]|nr:hypothetical protein BDB01DRAFT_862821 [Pilobolus umbonatus]